MKFPLIIVSWEELEDFDPASDSFNLLDIIIGELLAHQKFEERAEKRVFRDDDDVLDLEIETALDFNPIVQEINRMFLLVSNGKYGEGYRPLRDREHQGYIGAMSYLFTSKDEVVLSVSFYIRDINCSGMKVTALLPDLGTYLLYKKAMREFGLERPRR